MNPAASGHHGLDRLNFLSLPAELIIAIIARLSDDRPALCSLAQTCRYLKPLAEEHIYSTIELLSTDDLRAIIVAFSKDPTRVAAVTTLKILYKHHEALSTTVEERRQFNGYIKQMKLLRDWHVESPYDDFKWENGGSEWVEEDMQEFRRSLESASLRHGQPNFEDVGLAKLEKLIVHSHGADSDWWNLDDFHCLFRHPSLRTLHISCVQLPPDIPELESFISRTPLTTLVFDECELEPRSLGRILSTPKSLKHLTLGENVHNVKKSRGVQPKLTNAAQATVEALAPVAHSLESLTHIDPKFLTVPDPYNSPAICIRGSGLRNFNRLTSLEIDRCSFLHQGILANRFLSPPNLEVLRIYDPRKLHGNFWEDLPDLDRYIQLQSLKLLELIEPCDLRSSAYLADFVGEFDRTRERHAYAYKLWKHGIDLKMYAEVHFKYSFIPPYLHGEQTPVRLCLYDSVDIGFKRVVDDREDMEPIISEVVPTEQPNSFEIHLLPDEQSQSNANNSAEPPETDQLSKRDVARLRNQIWRIMQRHRSENYKPPQATIQMNLAGGGVILELVTDVSDEDDIDTDDIEFDLHDDWDEDLDLEEEEEEEDEDGDFDDFEDAEEEVDDDGAELYVDAPDGPTHPDLD